MNDEFTVEKLIRYLQTLPQDLPIHIMANGKRYKYIELFGNEERITIGAKEHSRKDAIEFLLSYKGEINNDN